MYYTRVGYAGGDQQGPTYEDLLDHSEAIEIGYDPATISFDELLAEFWAAHSPAETMWSRQYRSAIFVTTPEERAAAERSVTKAARRLGHPVHTAVEAAGTFWQAEAYHQKYRLRHNAQAWTELVAAYPAIDDLVLSTAAARLNAWASGLGDPEQRRKELPRVGLSEEAQRAFR